MCKHSNMIWYKSVCYDETCDIAYFSHADLNIKLKLDEKSVFSWYCRSVGTASANQNQALDVCKA